MTDLGDVREFLFRGLMFEADADSFRRSGVQIGSEAAVQEEARLLSDALSPFPLTVRSEALRMARLYAVIFCFEASVRQLIEDRLVERVGVDWWEECVPKKVKETADSRRKSAAENSWLEGETGNQMGFVDFGGLAAIIIQNWEHFSDLISSQQWLRQRFDEIEQARNFVAHNRFLQPGEFQRLYMYIGDYNRQVGF